jgi:hypothetical protein
MKNERERERKREGERKKNEERKRELNKRVCARFCFFQFWAFFFLFGCRGNEEASEALPPRTTLPFSLFPHPQQQQQLAASHNNARTLTTFAAKLIL